MIYLIITTSIINRYGTQNDKERKERYFYAINETLKYLPAEIIPIIVENNGHRSTYLDNFYHNNKIVKVHYTENNKRYFKSKGINEFLDIKSVISEFKINNDDIIIKLTGRYRITSPLFFNEIIDNFNNFDAFIKFYGTCSLQFEHSDCILGCYAMRTIFIKLFNEFTIDNYLSAEIAFARYARICGAKLKEIEKIDVECSFSDDLRILNV